MFLTTYIKPCYCWDFVFTDRGAEDRPRRAAVPPLSAPAAEPEHLLQLPAHTEHRRGSHLLQPPAKPRRAKGAQIAFFFSIVYAAVPDSRNWSSFVEHFYSFCKSDLSLLLFTNAFLLCLCVACSLNSCARRKCPCPPHWETAPMKTC